jgi:hypothetical protein
MRAPSITVNRLTLRRFDVALPVTREVHRWLRLHRQMRNALRLFAIGNAAGNWIPRTPDGPVTPSARRHGGERHDQNSDARFHDPPF